MLLELLARDREPVDELLRGDVRLAVVAAGREEVGEQRLQDAEALRRDRACRALGQRIGDLARDLGGRLGSRAFVGPPRGARALGHEPAQLGRLERDGAAVLPQDPACEQGERRVLGDEHIVLEPVAGPVVHALHPPRGVRRNLDASLALHVAELPLGAAAVALDVELGRQPEIALAPRREADVRTDPRDPERPDVLALEVVADHVPRAVLGQERVRVQRPLLLVVAVDRPVAELHRALLRDRALELAEAALQLGRVVGVAHLDAPRGARRRRCEIAGRAPEGEVLEGEPQRLGVGEAALEEVEAGLERRELVVVELELRQEVALRPKRVELLAGELVALRVERHAERDQLGAVRVEAAGERLVAHLLVALDVGLDVARCQRSPLRHQERDQRELANQFVGVVAHPEGSSLADRSGAACARRRGLRRDLAALEVLMRGAVLALRQRRALARLALAGRRPAAGHAAVERTGLDLVLDE